ncbi:uncharacterized protein LOC143149644 [Ptiloglossa arizonensis]|uniref:uncharacterized protein LOC143149644 n=1 Tax=Ptiloglossa arizonensis TaxID=3350558 RepID=UPI003FA001AA
MQTNVRPMVVSGAESANIPPVPPRRKKRKAKFAETVNSPQGTSPTSQNNMPDRKRLPPPPPPPPRVARKVKYDKDQQKGTILNRVIEDMEDTLDSLSLNEIEGTLHPSSLQFEDTDLIPTKETRNNTNDKNDNHVTDRAATPSNKRPFSLYEAQATKETNNYPPLFFTLHDFQNVMSSTLQHEETTDDKSSIEFVSSVRESFEHSLDDEENELCFRVTTTNLPFEKSKDRWSNPFADQFFEQMDDTNHYIFEDYIDRSNKVNIRRSAGPMCYDTSIEEVPAVPRLSKVRFVIESPSSSTPDYEFSEDGEAMCDSLQNIDPLVDEEVGYNCVASAQLTDVTGETDRAKGSENEQDSQMADQFGDVPFTSVLKNRTGTVEWSPLRNVSSPVGVANQGSRVEDDNARFVSSDSFRRSVSLDSRNESFDSVCTVNKLETGNANEENHNSRKSNTEDTSERVPAVDEIEDESSKESNENNNSGLVASTDCIAHVEESPVVKDDSDGVHENENNNVHAIEETSVQNTNEIVYNIIQRRLLTADSRNNVLVKQMSIGKRGFEIDERTSTINETKIEDLDRRLGTNEILDSVSKEHFISNRVKSDVDKEVSSIEERIERDEEVSMESNSVDKTSREHRRKLFVDESLRNITNHHDSLANDTENIYESFETKSDSSDTWNFSLKRMEESSQESNAKNSMNEIENISFFQKTFENREGVSTPVNVRRNSFLENMLVEDSNEAWNVSHGCQIVGIHPKLQLPVTHEESIPVMKEENKLAHRLNESIRMDTEIQKILQESNELSKKVNTVIPKSRSPTIVQSNKKNVSEMKCTVLNELLSNFGNIKLKSVNSERRTDTKCLSQDNLSLNKELENKERIESKLNGCARTFNNNADNSPIDDTSKGMDNVNSKRTIHPLPSTITNEVNDKQISTRFSSNRDQEPVSFNNSTELFGKSERFRSNDNSFSRNAACTSEYIDSLRNCKIRNNCHREIVKVEVHRSESFTNEDYSESSMSTSEFQPKRVEPNQNIGSKDDVSLGTNDGVIECSVEPLQEASCSEKTDAKVCEDELDDRGYMETIEPYDRGTIERQLDLRRRTGSGDKSAIARRIPRSRCNNNDNNRAVIPVAVSDDQSRDTVTITPGRVRSFVKYYEIRGEATTDKDSKTNDRDKVETDTMTGHQSVFSIRRGLEARANEARSYDPRRIDYFQMSAVDKSGEKLVDSTSKETKCSAITKKVQTERDDSSRSNDRDAEVPEDPAETKTMRNSSEKSYGDSSTQPGSVTNRDAKSTGKRKAPDRPTTEETMSSENVDFKVIKPEELDADSFAFEKREIAAQIHAAAGREECSGINRFVPKTETPRLVFYCTV